MKAAALLPAALLASAAAGAATLGYVPTEATRPQPAAPVGAVSVIDARDEKDPTYVGAIRNTFGIPLKTLTTQLPVRDEVGAAFMAALQTRGLFNPRAPAVLTVTLTQLSANQHRRREGHTIFSVVLSDRATGRPLFQDQEDVLKVTGSYFGFDRGVFASIEDLRAVTVMSLSQAIDQALDKLTAGMRR